MTDAKLIEKLKIFLDNIEYKYLSVGDLGNEIGYFIADHLTDEETKEDFIHGIRHGISLKDDTHG